MRESWPWTTRLRSTSGSQRARPPARRFTPTKEPCTLRASNDEILFGAKIERGKAANSTHTRQVPECPNIQFFQRTDPTLIITVLCFVGGQISSRNHRKHRTSQQYLARRRCILAVGRHTKPQTTNDEPRTTNYSPAPSISSKVFGQSDFSSRERLLSASNRPSFWQLAQ